MTADELLKQETDFIGGFAELQQSGRNVFRGMITGLTRSTKGGKIIITLDDLKQLVGMNWITQSEKIVSFHESDLNRTDSFQEGVLKIEVTYFGTIILYQKGVLRPTPVYPMAPVIV